MKTTHPLTKDIHNIHGVIFDMDGVLVDSERLYLHFWREASASFGFAMSEAQALSLRSNSPEAAIPKFRAWFGDNADYHAIRARRRDMMAEWIDREGVALKQGAAEVTRELKAHGYRIALATASPLRRAEHYLAPHGLWGIFDAVIGGPDVTRSKPAPDIYLAAAAALRLPPTACLAAEDSPSGVRAAHDAGCFTVMIPALTPPDGESQLLADCVLDNLTQLRTLLL